MQMQPKQVCKIQIFENKNENMFTLEYFMLIPKLKEVQSVQNMNNHVPTIDNCCF